MRNYKNINFVVNGNIHLKKIANWSQTKPNFFFEKIVQRGIYFEILDHATAIFKFFKEKRIKKLKPIPFLNLIEKNILKIDFSSTN